MREKGLSLSHTQRDTYIETHTHFPTHTSTAYSPFPLSGTPFEASDTHTHTHTPSLSHIQPLSLSCTYTCCLSRSLHTHTHSQVPPSKLVVVHTHTLPLSHTRSFSHNACILLFLSNIYTHRDSPSLAHTAFLPLSRSLALSHTIHDTHSHTHIRSPLRSSWWGWPTDGPHLPRSVGGRGGLRGERD